MDLEVGFLDHFFAKMLVQEESLRKCFAKLIHLSRQGHLCSTVEELGTEALQLPSSLVSERTNLTPIVKDGNRFYLQKNWVYETLILEHVQRLRSLPAPSFFDRSVFQTKLSATQVLSKQADAIASVLTSSLTLICGGPGTGKTYTAAKLVSLLLASLRRTEKKSFRVCLSAPTGKAAAHFESILSSQDLSDPIFHIQTATLHRLLRLQPGENRLFSQGLIDADLVIIDEASMIDVPLLAHLLSAIGDHTLLVLMGDPDQLPPVDAGSLFGEIASSYGIFLEKSLRTEESSLHDLASAVKKGDFLAVATILEKGDPSAQDISWQFDSSLAERLYREIDPIISYEKPDPKTCLKKYQRYRILNALRQGPFGVDALNEEIFRLLQQKKQKGQWWAIPILITVNDPRSGLYNGTSGILIGQNLQTAGAYFPDDSEAGVRFLPTPPSYEKAFCLSIHKSQGSEFEKVLALLPEGSENFGREALYTAVTRSRKELGVVAKKETLEAMLKSHSRKKSGFLERTQSID